MHIDEHNLQIIQPAKRGELNKRNQQNTPTMLYVHLNKVKSRRVRKANTKTSSLLHVIFIWLVQFYI